MLEQPANPEMGSFKSVGIYALCGVQLFFTWFYYVHGLYSYFLLFLVEEDLPYK